MCMMTKTKKTVKLEEMLLVYPSNMPGDNATIRSEFVNTMLRSKSKAERGAIIATGLLPVRFALDMLMVVVWPFGGLLELMMSAFTLAFAAQKLVVVLLPRLEKLEKYLAAACHEKDSKLFPKYASALSESEVLEAIGWFPSTKGGEEKNWEDEQWEIMQVKDDLKGPMGKGARKWDKRCKPFAKEPEKASKK